MGVRGVTSGKIRNVRCNLVESGATWHEIDVSPVFQLCERKYCYNARQWYGIDIVAYYFNFF